MSIRHSAESASESRHLTELVFLFFFSSFKFRRDCLPVWLSLVPKFQECFLPQVAHACSNSSKGIAKFWLRESSKWPFRKDEELTWAFFCMKRYKSNILGTTWEFFCFFPFSAPISDWPLRDFLSLLLSNSPPGWIERRRILDS